MPRSAIIEVQNLCKQYHGLVAVQDLSFQVRAGECFGLLGPNGAGKTTTIRMLYGFAPPTSGLLRIFGLDVACSWREIRSRIGVCQQDNTLDPDLSVFQNLIVFAGYFNISRRQASQRAEELLDFFALDRKRDAKVGELSGGLARRLTLARALINDPELVVLDEPTTGLDPQSRHLLWERLAALRSQGKTFLLTTHYMEEAARLCDRLMIIDHGRILVEGAPDELIRTHVGGSIIEVTGADEEITALLRTRNIDYDAADNRLIIYASSQPDADASLRALFQPEQCTFRSPTLEDVFLRLTGRELRE